MYLQAKVVVIYDGVSLDGARRDGATERMRQLALAVRDGARERGAEVRVRRVAEDEGGIGRPCVAPCRLGGGRPVDHLPEAAPDDLDWADVALFGTPRRDAVLGPDLKRFVDAAGALRRSGRLARKVYGVFAPATPSPRGVGTRLLALGDVFHAWRGLVVPARCVGVFEPDPGDAGWTTADAAAGQPSQAELAAARCHGRRATDAALALGASRRVLHEVA